jgi:pimeloyl-ACP methyl ester carboxylesterase
MAKARPELFHAYVGLSQIVDSREGQPASYAKVMALARAAGDAATVAKLDAIGAPPWKDPRSPGVLRRATRTYEAKTATPAPRSWWVRAPAYDIPKMLADDEEGEDYSYLEFVGLKGEGMFSKVDLRKLGADFALPVFIVHGTEDLVAIPEVARRWFDAINAPRKAFIAVPGAGHDPNVAMVEAEYRVLMDRVRPLAT